MQREDAIDWLFATQQAVKEAKGALTLQTLAMMEILFTLAGRINFEKPEDAAEDDDYSWLQDIQAQTLFYRGGAERLGLTAQEGGDSDGEPRWELTRETEAGAAFEGYLNDARKYLKAAKVDSAAQAMASFLSTVIIADGPEDIMNRAVARLNSCVDGGGWSTKGLPQLRPTLIEVGELVSRLVWKADREFAETLAETVAKLREGRFTSQFLGLKFGL